MTARGFRIPWDVPLIMKVFCLAGYYTLLVRFVSIKKILDPMRERSLRTRAVEGDTASKALLLDRAWRASNFFLGRFLKQRDFCLPRTLALYRWCTSMAIDAGMIIGVRKDGDALKGHAWLVVDGAPYRENIDDLVQFAPMLRV
jgi:hypothetical protein